MSNWPCICRFRLFIYVQQREELKKNNQITFFASFTECIPFYKTFGSRSTCILPDTRTKLLPEAVRQNSTAWLECLAKRIVAEETTR